MGKEQRTSSSSAAMCTPDSNSKNGQNDARTPLRSITGQTAPVSPTTTGPMAQVGQNTNSSGRWASPTKTPASHDGAPVESFELEDNNTIGSGGTSWTLRVPWLRNKRRRRYRQDDENSSIQTDHSRSIIGKPGAPAVVGVEDTEAVYYGGLMKTASPEVVSLEADNNIEAPQRGVEKDGLIRDSPKSSRRSKRNRSKSKSKRKGLHSSRKSSSSSSLHASLEKDQNLLPQHTTPPPHANTASTTPSATVAGATSNSAESAGSHRKFFLSNTPGLEPKNNNKVFRNRSWISTSSRESEGGGGRRRTRHRGSEDDSLADFDEAEWTPQDSAYGAAIPVCGWVPKRLRQGLEATLIAFTIFALVYWIVTTSISVSEGKGDGSYSSYNDSRSNALEVDDDWYVEYSQMQNDEDDYFNNERENNNNHGG